MKSQVEKDFDEFLELDTSEKNKYNRKNGELIAGDIVKVKDSKETFETVGIISSIQDYTPFFDCRVSWRNGNNSFYQLECLERVG